MPTVFSDPRRRFLPLIWSALAGIALLLIVVSITTGMKAKAADFFCFYDAAVAARHGQDIYASGTGGYIYPPLLAFLLIPLSLFPPAFAAIAWKLGTVFAIILATFLCSFEWSGRFRFRWDTQRALGAAAIVWALLADKMMSQVQLGQSDLLLIIPFILGLHWLGKKPLACGIALGFAVHIKYLSLVFLPYLLVRGRWKEAWGMVASIAFFAALPSAWFGWQRNMEYLLTAMRGMGSMAADRTGVAGSANIHEITWERSVSIPSAAARLAERMQWDAGAAVWLTAGAALVLFAITWVIYRRNRAPMFVDRRPRTDDVLPERRAIVALEWSGLIAAALLFSPQTTARHFILLFPVLVGAASLVLRSRPSTPRIALSIGLVLLMLGLVLPPGGREYADALRWWRGIGGASWCLVVFLFAFLDAGLKESGIDGSARDGTAASRS